MMIWLICIPGRHFKTTMNMISPCRDSYRANNSWSLLVFLNVKDSYTVLGFPCSSVGKESACNAGHLGLTPGLGRCLGERNGNPLQYSWLENPLDRGAWQSAAHGVARIGYNLATKPLPHSLGS